MFRLPSLHLQEMRINYIYKISILNKLTSVRWLNVAAETQFF
jgi:hypothetical protein